jgi:hypothetical protein
MNPIHRLPLSLLPLSLLPLSFPAFCVLPLFLITALGPSARAQTAPDATFQITGAVTAPRSWSVTQLKKQMAGDVTVVAYTLRGKRHTAHAVSLWTLLQAAGPRVNPQIKHHLLQFIVAVRGPDGYTADFTLGELSPDFGDRAVWVALDEDGKPLRGDAGPVQLLAPGDKKPARWVHAVRAIILTDGALLSAPAGT